jgi:formylglycine-generating enzyme required for sulfatase activity
VTIRCALPLFAALFSATPGHARDEIKDCNVCPELVVVPAGQFMIGSNSSESSLPDEKPAHLVTIAKSFAVGKFEVTLTIWTPASPTALAKRLMMKVGGAVSDR